MALRALFPRTGRAYVVGLTGAPGAGKSSLTDRLIAHHRAHGRTVGVVAVDPTSPFTGGAILGDRIRMQDHALDPGVFIRSLGTRGHLGGLSRSTADVVQVLDAMGKDVILVETVGVGQDEIEVAELAHTVVVVAVPGLGRRRAGHQGRRPRDRRRVRGEQGRPRGRRPHGARPAGDARAAPGGAARGRTTTGDHGSVAQRPGTRSPPRRTWAGSRPSSARWRCGTRARRSSPRQSTRHRAHLERRRSAGPGRRAGARRVPGAAAGAAPRGRAGAARGRRAGSTRSRRGSRRGEADPYALADELAAGLRPASRGGVMSDERRTAAAGAKRPRRWIRWRRSRRGWGSVRRPGHGAGRAHPQVLRQRAPRRGGAGRQRAARVPGGRGHRPGGLAPADGAVPGRTRGRPLQDARRGGGRAGALRDGARARPRPAAAARARRGADRRTAEGLAPRRRAWRR